MVPSCRKTQFTVKPCLRLTFRQTAVADRRTREFRFGGGTQWSEHFTYSQTLFQHRLSSVRAPVCRLLGAGTFVGMVFEFILPSLEPSLELAAEQNQNNNRYEY